MKKILFVLIVIVAGAAFYYGKPSSNRQLESDENVSKDLQTENRKVVNGELGYSILLPKDMTEEKNGRFSRLFARKTSQPEDRTTNFIYISVVPNGMSGTEGEIYNYNRQDLQRLKALNIGQTANLTDTDNQEIAKYYKYERLEDRMLGGYGATVYVNKNPWEFPVGTSEYRFVIPFEQATYLIGYYTGTDKLSSHLTKAKAEAILETLKISPSGIVALPIPTPDKNWVKFKSDEFGISFEHPSSWKKREGGQSFENGDLVAFQVIGQTQRPQTELYDGLSFAVMNPIDTDTEVEVWTKKTYGTTSEFDPENPPQYSMVSFGGKRYEKVVVCGLGCFTYYHIKQNGKIYGFMVMAVGPNEESYNEAVSRLMSGISYD